MSSLFKNMLTLQSGPHSFSFLKTKQAQKHSLTLKG